MHQVLVLPRSSVFLSSTVQPETCITMAYMLVSLYGHGWTSYRIPYFKHDVENVILVPRSIGMSCGKLQLSVTSPIQPTCQYNFPQFSVAVSHRLRSAILLNLLRRWIKLYSLALQSSVKDQVWRNLSKIQR